MACWGTFRTSVATTGSETIPAAARGGRTNIPRIATKSDGHCQAQLIAAWPRTPSVDDRPCTLWKAHVRPCATTCRSAPTSLSPGRKNPADDQKIFCLAGDQGQMSSDPTTFVLFTHDIYENFFPYSVSTINLTDRINDPIR